MATIPLAAAAKILFKERKHMIDDPVEGFQVLEISDTDIYQWTVAIFGPPDTIYSGGYFKAILRFPGDYPFSPPSFRFTTKMWHPNIYENGEVCISILHPSTDQVQGGELPEERWNPTQNVRTIIMSIISLLNEPNINSPANVDASIMYRDYTTKQSPRFKDVVKKYVEESRVQAVKDGVVIPETQTQYTKKRRESKISLLSQISKCSGMTSYSDILGSPFSDDELDSSDIEDDYDDDADTIIDNI